MVIAILQDWEAAGHEDAGAWLDVLGPLGALTLTVVVVALVLRALVRQNRYRAVGVLTGADEERVRAAIRACESRTVGEVLPVVLGRSDRHPGALWMSALAFVLVGTALLGSYFPWHAPALVVLVQLALGALGYAIARSLPAFQRLFVSEARATEMAEEQAFQEFYAHELHETDERTGVLILVSLLEQRVVVLADEGIDAKVTAEDWKAVDVAVLRHVARGALADGLVAGVEQAGVLLAEHFPWREGDRNEIPDRLVVRAE